MRKILIIGIILLFIGASVVSGFNTNSSPQPMERGWLYVGGSGPENYTMIQLAIDVASDGDTIFVYNGTYNENVVITKNTLTLIGENKETTVINALYGPMASIYVDTYHSATISGFTLHCPDMAGVYFRDSYDNIIFDCIMSNCKSGATIYTEHTTVNNKIFNCEMYNNTWGIFLGGGDNNYYINQSNIFNCMIHNNVEDGIFITGRMDYSGIINNTIITRCNIYNNTGKGIWVYQQSGKILGVNVYHNNFINNSITAYDNTNNTWYNIDLHQGNYWDEYTGQDNDGDGIGDIPYNIYGGNNQDLYPFMEPNGWVNKPPVANFTYTIDELTVNFDASSSYDPDGEILVWYWTFGDGVSGVGETFHHDYLKSGTYNVTLTVVDDGSKEDVISKEITIESYKKAIIFGRITNLTTEGKKISFETVNTRVITFSPFSWIPYPSGEKLIISNGYSGFIGYRYVFTLCRMLI